MTRLRNRIIPADWMNDGRLLSVCPQARALALVLEHVAEDTGVLSENPMELRSLGGQYLSEIDGTLPSIDRLSALMDELAGVTWLIRYERDGLPLAYLKGFGDRQLGPSVGIGVAKSTGEIAPHLPLPDGCVTLDTSSDKWRASNRARPVHCDRPYSACPSCQLGANRKLATSWLQQPELELEARKESEPQALQECEAESEIKPRGEGVTGKGSDLYSRHDLTSEERKEEMLGILGNARYSKAQMQAEQYAASRGHGLSDKTLLFYLEAEASR